jgi:hypothetical protein
MYLQKVVSRKTWRLSRAKIAGFGAGSGSTGQRPGSGSVLKCHGSTTLLPTSYVVIGLVPIELGEIGLGAFSSSKTDRDFSEPSLIMVSNETLPVPSIFNSIGGR